MHQFYGIDAVLFDLDGTLIDSAPDLGAAADKMRTDRGLHSLSDALYRPMAGSGARGMLKVALDIDPDHADFAQLREEFFVNYENAMTVRTTVFAGVSELIAQLMQRQLLWGVVTNKSKRFTEPLTRALPLFASASAIVSGDTTAHAKPHPEPLFEAARRLGLAPERCLYVGDDERDIVAGKAAGMATVAVSYGYLGAKTDLMSWGAEATMDAPADLLQFLRE
ncbi:MAG: HAD-IA family hydrolase [Burkholderiaceae bacterium]